MGHGLISWDARILRIIWDNGEAAYEESSRPVKSMYESHFGLMD